MKHKQLLAKKKLTANDERVLAELAARLSKIVDAMGGDWVPSKHDLENYVGPISDDEWSSLSRMIGLTPESRAELSALVQVQDRPVFFLDDEHAFYVHGVQGFDALFNAFDEIAQVIRSYAITTVIAWRSGWNNKSRRSSGGFSRPQASSVMRASPILTTSVEKLKRTS